MAKPKFKLGDEVWRVQSTTLSGELNAAGPATVTAVVHREDGVTYLLTWPRGKDGDIEILDEQGPEDLFKSERLAQSVADRRHNASLRREMR